MSRNDTTPVERPTDSKETRCPVCGPVEGRIPHEVEDLPAATDRLDLAQNYLDRQGLDPQAVGWPAVEEALDHVANLRRRAMGFVTREEIEERWSQ